MEPTTDYHADNSRSDLSDILEEEEEDLYSDHLGEAQARGYTVGINRVKEQSIPHIFTYPRKYVALCTYIGADNESSVFLLLFF